MLRWPRKVMFPLRLRDNTTTANAIFDKDALGIRGIYFFGSVLEVSKLMPTKDEVFEKIQAALVDALGVDEEDVKPEATLVGDLGAESIDFLDIVFRLEKAFDIKIPRGELFPEDILTDAKYVQDGKVTETGLAELRKRMPFANLDEFSKNPVVQDFGNLLTVADMCRFVEGKVEVTE